MWSFFLNSDYYIGIIEHQSSIVQILWIKLLQLNNLNTFIFDTEKKTAIAENGCCEVSLDYPLYVNRINQTFTALKR